MLDCRNLKVGDKVYVAALYRDDRGLEGVATVSKVGRKYVTLGERSWAAKFAIETGMQNNDGYSPYFELYASKEAYIEAQNAETLRRNLVDFIRAGRVGAFPLSTLQAAAEAIGMPREKWGFEPSKAEE